MKAMNSIPLSGFSPRLRASASPRYRAAAMIETVLVLPVIFVLLLMLLYYGWSMQHLQQASVQDRYEAWRWSYGAPGPRPTLPDHPQINTTFWNDAAIELTFDTSLAFPPETRDELIAEAQTMSQEAGDLANELLTGNLPHGRTVEFDTQVGWQIESLTDIDRPITHGHTRIANEWKHANAVRQRADGEWIESVPAATPGSAVSDVFLIDLDTPMSSIASGSSGDVATAVRRMYRSHPGYYGPDVDYQFLSN